VYRLAFRAMLATNGIDVARVVVVGMSNGGGVAPLVPDGLPVVGYVVSGGWYKTWFEHMVELERRRLTLSGTPPGKVAETMKHVERLYDLYLNERRLPGEVVRSYPELADAWTDEPDHQYGRPAAFYQQLQALNLATAWSKVDAPVLAVHGEYDWIMSRDDPALLVRALNALHPGRAELVEVARMDHFYTVHADAVAAFKDEPKGEYTDEAAERIVRWIRALVAR
jgi:pimeloyl-ACP methyl ester carboxylesterase